MPNVPPFAAYLFDLDGTVYLSDIPLPGAIAALLRLKARGAQVMYLTNKPLYSPEEYATKLSGLGLPAEPEEVLTSSLALGSHLAAHDRGARVLVLGEAQVQRDVTAAGCRIVSDWREAEIVVLGWDRAFSYERLNAAMQAIRRGARFYATNPDVACPLGEGEAVPDCGALIAAIEACTGHAPDFVAGKPGPGMAAAALQHLGRQPEECLLVGDRLQTDMVCGRRAGMKTCLVLTGVTDEATLAAATGEAVPDYVLPSVAELA